MGSKASKQRPRPRLMRWFGEELKRLRHFRGHGVHSPYIYSIVRNVYMYRKLIEPIDAQFEGELKELQASRTIDKREAQELQNIYAHCGYNSYEIAPDISSSAEYLIIIPEQRESEIVAILNRAVKNRSTVVLLRDNRRDMEHENLLYSIAEQHASTSVDRGAYLLLFNNHLPKQHFIL